MSFDVPHPWMSITAFKQDADLYRVGVAPFWFHLPPTLEHFTRLFTGTYFTAQLLNTLQLAIYVVALTMLMAVPAGYSLARLKLPGAENLGIALFLTYLVPPIILFHSAGARGRRSRAVRLVVGVRARVSRLHHPILHLEDDGLLQDRPARGRGGGVAGRLQPRRRPLAGCLAGKPDRHRGLGDLRVLALDAGVSLRRRVRGAASRESG